MSITNKKKISSTPNHSIKEHQDDKTDDHNIEKRTSRDNILVDEIHTINDWEHADLGDEQRKQKFLRLMGAKKRKDESGTDTKDSHSIDHNEESASEKKHCRSKTQNEAINRELEKQFNEGLQSTILHTHHEGIGFLGDETAPTTSNCDNRHHQIKTTFVPATIQIQSPLSSESTRNRTQEDPH